MHPITNLYDLKRRLGVGRRCFGYFHSALPGSTTWDFKGVFSQFQFR